MDSTSFYGIDKGLWDRDSVTLQNQETTAQGLDFISEQGARCAYTDSWPSLGMGSKILGGKLHPHPGIQLPLAIMNVRKLFTIGDYPMAWPEGSLTSQSESYRSL